MSSSSKFSLLPLAMSINACQLQTFFTSPWIPAQGSVLVLSLQDENYETLLTMSASSQILKMISDARASSAFWSNSKARRSYPLNVFNWMLMKLRNLGPTWTLLIFDIKLNGYWVSGCMLGCNYSNDLASISLFSSPNSFWLRIQQRSKKEKFHHRAIVTHY